MSWLPILESREPCGRMRDGIIVWKGMTLVTEHRKLDQYNYHIFFLAEKLRVTVLDQARLFIHPVDADFARVRGHCLRSILRLPELQ